MINDSLLIIHFAFTLRSSDVVYPLPDGWPRLQEKLFKRRNLYFRKPASPSISNVIHHLQQLQDKIEAWSREVELEILSQRSSSLNSVVDDGPSYQEGRHGLGSKLSAGQTPFTQ